MGRHPSPTLTPRQRKVLQLIVQGCGNKEIARKLSISEKTVEDHVHRLLVKFYVTSRVELVAYTLQNGFVTTGETGDIPSCY